VCTCLPVKKKGLVGKKAGRKEMDGYEKKTVEETSNGPHRTRENAYHWGEISIEKKSS